MDRDRRFFGETARRLGWMLLLWVGGVAAVGAVSVLLRLVMVAAGMRSVG